MTDPPWTRLLRRGEQYLRAARFSHNSGDLDAAFENARMAAELGAKAMLERSGHGYGKDHNVAGTLVRAGLWPKSRGSGLSRLLSEYVRGVYSFTKTVSDRDARGAVRLAANVLETARSQN